MSMSMSRAGKDFLIDQKKSGSVHTCRRAGFLILPMKISPVWQIFLFVKLTIRFIIFYN